MPKLPVLNGGNTTREVIDIFAGYNHNLKIQDGEFFFTENLTSDYYPLMANRKPRGEITMRPTSYSSVTDGWPVGSYCTHDGKIYRCNTAIATTETWNAEHWDEAASVFAGLQGMIAKAGKSGKFPYFVAGGNLYGDFGDETDQDMRPLMSGLITTGQKQLVSMGAYICIFPDKMYFNTEDPDDHGSMEANWYKIAAVPTYAMCHQDGTVYSTVTRSNTEPASPNNGDLWVDTTDNTVREYSESSATWIILETVYTKVTFTNTKVAFGDMFKEFDGVEISGLHYDDLNGSKILYAVGGDSTTDAYVVLVGLLGDAPDQPAASVSIRRLVPDMDYVCEAQNRLWGCKYGLDADTGKTINEIYCCALGDFKNWSQYLGVATDSWRASRGSDGPWTGCVNYFGTPTFFKENVIHPVTVSPVGAHQIGDIPGRGVQNGSWRSMAIVNETLYYKADTGIMAYQGGLPVNVSSALGELRYYNGVAGSIGQKYYICLQNEVVENTVGPNNNHVFFCYDAGKGIWMREDNLNVSRMERLGDMLYIGATKWIDDDPHGMLPVTTIYVTDGTRNDWPASKEAAVSWIAESGIQHYQYPDKKYVSRYNIRLQLAKGARMKMFIEYDSKGPWVFVGNVENGDVMTDNTGTANVPVKPRRCDHLRLRFEGTGDVRVLSITRVLQKGSDM